MNSDLKWLAENVEVWPCMNYHKVQRVNNAQGYVCVTGNSDGGYTRDQWQAARRELGLDKPQWRGPEDGLPPVGFECEAYGIGGWHRAEVLKHDQTHAAVVNTETHELFWAERFRPIRTEEEKAVDEIMQAIDAEQPDVSNVKSVVERVFAAGYGYRKQESD